MNFFPFPPLNSPLSHAAKGKSSSRILLIKKAYLPSTKRETRRKGIKISTQIMGRVKENGKIYELYRNIEMLHFI
jgi:hypothetical protein